MYIIEPYKYIEKSNRKIELNNSSEKIEELLGSTLLESNQYAPEYLTGFYLGGLTISYTANLSCYIGILISLLPKHKEFNFFNKTYEEVMIYFKTQPGNIYIEDETAIISEHLGISVYFEDGIKEVGIFSKSYGESIIKTLELTI